MTIRDGDHANEFETSLMLYLTPELVDMAAAEDGGYQAFRIPAIAAPGIWAPRDWQALTASTGTGDPRHGNAVAGGQIFERLVGAFVPLLVQLSAAHEGDFPYVIRR